jgi:predicted nucleotidyltransferase
MDQTAVADPILLRLKAELQKLYGPRLKQALLYGSRARGDHRPDSDYDVLVVLEEPFDHWAEVHRLAGLSTDLTWATVENDHPVVASFKPMTPEQFQARTGFLHNVRREAIAL